MRYYKKAIAAIMAVAVLVGLEPYIERINIHGVQYASAQTSEDTIETSAQLSESATGIPTQTPDVTQGVSACDYYQNMSTIGKDTSVVTISNADDLRAYMKIMQKVTGFGLTFVQTADIALSDYNFRYDKSLKRIAVYDGDTLKCTVASNGTAYQPDNSDRSASYVRRFSMVTRSRFSWCVSGKSSSDIGGFAWRIECDFRKCERCSGQFGSGRMRRNCGN